jgi:OmpA-OmpF porin, OOP family
LSRPAREAVAFARRRLRKPRPSQAECHLSKKGWIAATLGAAAMAMSAGALAQKQSEIGWYAGFSLGKSDDLDDELAWKIHGGYQVNRNVAVEFGYTSLGERSPGFGTHVEASALELIGLYKHPLDNRIWIYGLAGLARIETETTVPFFGTVKNNSTELTLGIGVQYDFSRQLGVRAQFQDYDGLGVLSVGAVYKF